jgi:hypothetical protein
MYAKDLGKHPRGHCACTARGEPGSQCGIVMWALDGTCCSCNNGCGRAGSSPHLVAAPAGGTNAEGLPARQDACQPRLLCGCRLRAAQGAVIRCCGCLVKHAGTWTLPGAAAGGTAAPVTALVLQPAASACHSYQLRLRCHAGHQQQCHCCWVTLTWPTSPGPCICKASE